MLTFGFERPLTFTIFHLSQELSQERFKFQKNWKRSYERCENSWQKRKMKDCETERQHERDYKYIEIIGIVNKI
jgi:ribosomal protein L32E